MLYQLSYASTIMERETGIEPATNSLEGCDSTIELLPRFHRLRCRFRDARNAPKHRYHSSSADV